MDLGFFLFVRSRRFNGGIFHQSCYDAGWQQYAPIGQGFIRGLDPGEHALHMQILNIHERELGVPIEQAGTLIDSLASSDDRLWPGDTWPRMQFDRPLGAGADGGHGPIRYRVETFDPGRYIRFRFTSPRGFDGYHDFAVLALSRHRTLLRHRVKMQTRGLARLSWPLVIEPLHDALLEDALATGTLSLNLEPEIRPWSFRVRLLRWILLRDKPGSQRMTE
jgi:hypothetical protein